MINPLSVLVATPSFDGTTESGHTDGLCVCAAEHLFGSIARKDHCSDVRLARNHIVSGFLQSSFEWLVFIDADIIFTAKDFKLLMGYPILMGQLEDNFYDDATLYNDTPFISCAEYSRKNEHHETVSFGLGFCKIHRRVFDSLAALSQTDDTPVCPEFLFMGKMMQDFFYSGPLNGQWYTEDSGFFELVRHVGIIPYIEKRTQLVHVGKKHYPYG